MLRILLLLLALGAMAQAQAISVSINNPSFEFDATKPALGGVYDNTPTGWIGIDAPTETQIGTFLNPAAPADNHIDNLDGTKAAFMFASAGVTLYQQLSSTYEADTKYLFSAYFEHDDGTAAGTRFQMRLYYLNGSGVRTTVGTPTVVAALFRDVDITHLNLWTVEMTTSALDPFLGKNIGIEFLAVDTGGSYWDLDNVQLTKLAVPEPTATLLLLASGGLAALRRRA